jgi:hypothetical protein
MVNDRQSGIEDARVCFTNMAPQPIADGDEAGKSTWLPSPDESC